MTEVERTDGRLLAGRYRLGDLLGKGGMGTVWRAVDETLGRTVAVKELRFPGNVDEDEKRRLVTRTLREAKATARIRNTGAITVFDVVKEDDRPWIVMELVEGRSLSDVIREDGPLSPRRAAEVGLVLLDVLKAAHAEGILHRDVKPSNVLIADGGSDSDGPGSGRVVLSDFGIAQIDGDPSVTSTGMLVGAPSYISPERARGQKPGPPADLWSLGALLYAAVEGRPPYDKGSAIATLTAVMTEPVGPMSNAGPLADVIRGLLVKDPAQRLDEPGARALLAGVASTPERPASPPPGSSDARTAVLAVEPPAKPADTPPPSDGRTPVLPADTPPAPRTAPTDQARMRDALRSVRKAAAKPRPAPEPGTPEVTRPPAPSSITDVVPRRTLVIAAVVLAIALLGTVIGLVVANSGGSGGGSGDTKNGSTGGTTTTSTAPTPSQSHGKNGKGDKKGKGDGQDDQGDSSDSGDSQASSQPTTGAPSAPVSSAPGAVPAGWHKVVDAQRHFSIALPPGWRQLKVVEDGAGVVFAPHSGYPQVLVDFTPAPHKDAAADWRRAEPGVGGSTPGYKFLYIKPVTYRDYPTAADWEFMRSGDGQTIHVRDRGFVTDPSHGYAIMVSMPVSQWGSSSGTAIREGFFSSFEPTD